ncbi:LysR family transcriptional regulator [Psychromonas aquimarina]|uniref:LysR family transcriptional regulator n=1 Tax=Psychromonas aquimarina TaxID=444919 RepID=UPI0004108011|nr:LysR family transcriptional regulator [Psychromonas aquimarina]
MAMVSPNIEHLYYFTTVVEKGSFTAAGRHLGRDRSSIGQAVSNLEIDLGITLFERNGRAISITPEGDALYRRARTLLENYQSFCQFSSNLSANLESELTIGIDSFTSTRELAGIDAQIALIFPSLRLHWKRLPTLELDAALAEGETDLNIRLFKNHNLPEDFHVLHIDNVELIGLINSKDPKVKTSLIKHNELREIPLLVYPDLERIFRSDRFENMRRVFSRECALQIIGQKNSWTLGTKDDIPPESEHFFPVHIDTTDPLIVRRILVWHHGQTTGKAKRWLIDNIQSLLANLS